MRLAWLSAGAALALTACGTAPSTPVLVSGTVSANGLEMTLQTATVHDNPLPYLEGPPGSHCTYYRLEVRAVDGQRHDLRPSQFEAGGATAADAVARCGGPQLEPTWIDGRAQVVVVTILEDTAVPAPLSWRPD